MPITDFVELMYQERIEPFGEAANWLRAGVSFDFVNGIGDRSKAKPQTAQFSTPDSIHQFMQGFMQNNPGAIRMKPKKPS